jgi:hypothetical protein
VGPGEGLPGAPRRAALFPSADQRAQVRAYFNELLIDENLVFNVVPIPSTAAMITNAMPVAIRQYSIAVAPDSSERNARTVSMLSTYRASLSVG